MFQKLQRNMQMAFVRERGKIDANDDKKRFM